MIELITPTGSALSSLHRNLHTSERTAANRTEAIVEAVRNTLRDEVGAYNGAVRTPIEAFALNESNCRAQAACGAILLKAAGIPEHDIRFAFTDFPGATETWHGQVMVVNGRKIHKLDTSPKGAIHRQDRSMEYPGLPSRWPETLLSCAGKRVDPAHDLPRTIYAQGRDVLAVVNAAPYHTLISWPQPNQGWKCIVTTFQDGIESIYRLATYKYTLEDAQEDPNLYPEVAQRFMELGALAHPSWIA